MAGKWVKVQRCAEATPEFYTQEVFEILDSNGDGFVSLQDMQPLLEVAAKLQLDTQATKALKNCRNSTEGLNIKEFAGIFNEEPCVAEFYENLATEEIDAPSPASASNKPAETSPATDGGKAVTVAELEAQMRATAGPVTPPQAQAPLLSTLPSAQPPTPVCQPPFPPGQLTPLPVPVRQPLAPGLQLTLPIPMMAAPMSPSPYPMSPALAAPFGLAPSPSHFAALEGQKAASAKAEKEAAAAKRKLSAKEEEVLAAKKEIERLQAKEEEALAARKEIERLQGLVAAKEDEVAAANAAKEDELAAAKQDMEKKFAAAAQTVVSTTVQQLQKELATSQASHRASIGGDMPQIEESDDSEVEDVVPLPPSSGSWEWPLVRHEKKERLRLLERQEASADRKELKEKAKENRRLSFVAMPSCASMSDEE